MTAAGEADPAALAARISASLKAGLEQQPHVVGCSPDLIRVLTTYLDSAASMIAAAMDRDRLATELKAARAEAEAKDRRIAELEAERELFDEVCGHYALDEARFLRDEGEPYGSVPIEAGMMARQAGRRYAEREVAALAERTRLAQAVLGDPTAPEDDRHDAQFEIKMVGHAEARLAPLLTARTSGGHHGA